MGVHSTYTEAIAADICAQIAQGASLVTICARKGMPSRDTVHTWLNKHADFADKYARARDEQADYYADEMVAIADQVVGAPNEVVQAARLQIETRKWIASKLKPKKYGDKIQADVEHSGSVNVTQLTDAQLMAIASGKDK